ncbi:MAG: pyruvate ferredoxin oxidoreductase [Candidatus Aenigmatarchaeota archaeon]
MTKKVIEASHAIAEAVKLCEPKVIASYPITPQTHIVEKLADIVANGELDAEYINVESEHSAMSACVGAQATGVRTFTATSSQGLALMHEILFIASGMRLPIVMAVANRSLSAPLNIWNDWSDSFASRDSGWLQLYCETSQEAFDTIVQAYKIAEKINLPAMVCIDGFFLSHVYEPVDIATQADIRKFLPQYSKPLSFDNPVTQGSWAGPEHYQNFKLEQQKAMDEALKEIVSTNDEFEKMFGRSYGNGLLEEFNMEKAKYALLSMGTMCGTIKHVLIKHEITDVGLIRLKSFRPFPAAALRKATSKLEKVAVIEKDVSLGSTGALFAECATCTTNVNVDFITGLGGKDVTEAMVLDMIEKMKKENGVFWV